MPGKYKNRLRHAVHPAQKLAARRLFGSSGPDLGLLTVVVNIDNDAEHLNQCLVSVVGQSYTNLQIIVIDNDTFGESRRIAVEFAKWDKRIILVGAQDAALSAARGRYLTFADSKGVVGEGAYALMLSTIAQTGSDFVVGSTARLMGLRHQTTNISGLVHAQRRLHININDFPDIFDDVLVWNKIFQKEFWDQRVAPGTHNSSFADPMIAMRSFLKSKAFDVIEQVIYSGRRARQTPPWESESSIHADMVNMISTAREITSLIQSEGSYELLLKSQLRLFGADMMPYYEQVPRMPVTYWKELQTSIVELVKLMDTGQRVCTGASSKLDPHALVLLTLALRDLRHELEYVLVDRIQNGLGFQIVRKGEQFIALPNYWGRVGRIFNGQELVCRPESLEMVSHIDIRRSSETDELRLEGYGFIRGLAEEQGARSIVVEARGFKGDWQTLETQPAIDDSIDWQANDPYASHAGAACRAWIPSGLLQSCVQGKIDIKIVLTVGAYEFEEQHVIDLASPRQRHSGPVVVGFSIEKEPEKFAVDIFWGQERPPAVVYFATRTNQIAPNSKHDIGHGTYRYGFSLAQDSWGNQVPAPRSGAYTLRYDTEPGTTSGGIGKGVAVSDELSLILPQHHRLTHANVDARATAGKAFALVFSPPLNNNERGKYAQKELQRIFSEPKSGSLNRHIVLESFGGKYCTDNPAALSDELHERDPAIRIFWSIADFSVKYPDYAIPLIIGTNNWFNKITTAKLLINNNNFPHYFRKSNGQFYLQTWHGTPLKKIGLDSPSRYISPAYSELMAREALEWDLLLSQNSYSTNIFAKAFDYAGEILTSGYPRNDQLVSVASSQRRTTARELLGVTEAQTVVLYAPTWRDDAKSSAGAQQWVGFLDCQAAVEQLGRSYVFLVRAHHNVASKNVFTSGSNVIDVSSHPEINDLILASDLLITDYSSIIFDYMVTDKPVLFLAPDIEQYESDVRGFYLDYKSLTDGKRFNSTAEIVTLLQSGDSDQDLSFGVGRRQKFVPCARGQVSPDVVRRLLLELESEY